MSETDSFGVPQPPDYEADVKRLCPVLYRDGYPAWECGEGWEMPLGKLSYRLEALNAFFKREFGVYLEAEQIKEKFGTLRFYYSIKTCMRTAPETLRVFICSLSALIECKADFAYKHVQKKPPSETIICTEVSKPEGMGDFRTSPGGVTYEFGRMFRPAEVSVVPRKNRPLWLFLKALKRVYKTLSGSYLTMTDRQKMAMQCLEDLADDAISQAEKECYSRCESCGRNIGTESSPRCETVGWVNYLCTECASKKGIQYKVNGVLAGPEREDEGKN